eukprot:712265-Amphidinium_carterae.2
MSGTPVAESKQTPGTVSIGCVGIGVLHDDPLRGAVTWLPCCAAGVLPSPRITTMPPTWVIASSTLSSLTWRISSQQLLKACASKKQWPELQTTVQRNELVLRSGYPCPSTWLSPFYTGNAA